MNTYINIKMILNVSESGHDRAVLLIKLMLSECLESNDLILCMRVKIFCSLDVTVLG